jgi:hypothetical protein
VTDRDHADRATDRDGDGDGDRDERGTSADVEADADGTVWRFGVDDVGEDADEGPARPPLEPEPPSLENALFVALGVAGTVLLLLVGI